MHSLEATTRSTPATCKPPTIHLLSSAALFASFVDALPQMPNYVNVGIVTIKVKEGKQAILF